MSELSIIKETVTSVAQAITAALGIDTEIIDRHLAIIGGTGRYLQKLGRYEEGGDLDSGKIYSRLLKTGAPYYCPNAQSDPVYAAEEGELAEIACPILLDGQIVGLIGLVAFTRAQQRRIIDQHETLTAFLSHMADLLASKLSDREKRDQLNGILESMHDGLIALDASGLILSVNAKAEALLSCSRQRLEGRPMQDFWKLADLPSLLKGGATVQDKEYVYLDPGQAERRFLCSFVPLRSDDSTLVPESSPWGLLLLFQDVTTVREHLYRMTAGDENTSFDAIIGQSEPILQTRRRALQVASSDSTILITGESGVGKELFARAIHDASPRRKAPFVSVNCGAIPDMLLESELFGYERGAFTGANAGGKIGKFELAHRGTLFLDEIGDLPLHLQVKLLHALQNRQIDRVGGIRPIDVDVRIMAATNRDLDKMIQAREFREDLFFRLNVIPLIIPPLRDRPDDIEPLLRHALERCNRLVGKAIRGFSPEALSALLRYRWPGNVRELENVVEYTVNMEFADEIQTENLPEKVLGALTAPSIPGDSLKERTDACQRQIIEDCLNRTGRSTEGKAQAARLLGVSESTLYRRLRDLNLS